MPRQRSRHREVGETLLDGAGTQCLLGGKAITPAPARMTALEQRLAPEYPVPTSARVFG